MYICVRVHTIAFISMHIIYLSHTSAYPNTCHGVSVFQVHANLQLATCKLRRRHSVCSRQTAAAIAQPIGDNQRTLTSTHSCIGTHIPIHAQVQIHKQIIENLFIGNTCEICSSVCVSISQILTI